MALVALWGRNPAKIKKIYTIDTLSATMLVKTVIADLLWEMEFLQGRWAMARQDWQTINQHALNRQVRNRQVMHHRLQQELRSLRCRVQHVEKIAQSLPAGGGEAMGLSLLRAVCRTVLTQGDERHCFLGSLA